MRLRFSAKAEQATFSYEAEIQAIQQYLNWVIRVRFLIFPGLSWKTQLSTIDVKCGVKTQINF